MVSQELNRSTAKITKALLGQHGTIGLQNRLLPQTKILDSQIEKQQQTSTQEKYHQVQLKQKSSNSIKVATKEVYDLYKSQKYQAALNKANQLACHYPNVPWIYNIIAALNVHLKKYSDAINHYQKSLRLQPNSVDIQNTILRLLKCELSKDKTNIDFSTEDFLQDLMSFQETKAEQLFESAVSGWLYSACIDKKFIFQDVPNIVSKHRSPPDTHNCRSDGALAHEKIDAKVVLKQLSSKNNIAESWQHVQSLVKQRNALILGDSSLENNCKQIEKILDDNLDQRKFNIVIFGAGCVGLTLANALKNIFADKLDILVIDNRVSKEHIKKPYSRRWITHIDLLNLKNLVDPILVSLFEKFSNGRFLGTTINVFETLLLISCKSLGVKFYFTPIIEKCFIEKLNIDLAFDATACGLSTAIVEKYICKETTFLNLGEIGKLGQKYNKFGIADKTNHGSIHVNVRNKGRFHYPYIGEEKINTAMFKITNIPIGLYNVILDWIKLRNDDSLFYVWPGDLPEEINEVLILINLDLHSFKKLSEIIESEISLANLLNKKNFICSRIDQRIIDIFSWLSTQSPFCYKIKVEPPFLYSPYINSAVLGRSWFGKVLADITSGPAKQISSYEEIKTNQISEVYGKPLISVGDSIFNGNPKVGNGLGFHLKYLRELVLEFTYDFYKTYNKKKSL